MQIQLAVAKIENVDQYFNCLFYSGHNYQYHILVYDAQVGNFYM